jgi:uncharacterized membrane protein
MLGGMTLCLGFVGLTLSGGAAAQGQDDEMFAMMMTLMGGGIETTMDEAESSESLAMATELPAAYAGGFASIDYPGAIATRAFGISAVGEIVGSYTDVTGTHGYLLSNGTFTRIAFPGATSTEAWGINPQGDIVGRYRKPGASNTFGFQLSDGVFTDISVGTHMHTLPIKITPVGDIVGCFHDTNFLRDMRGYVQHNGRVSSFEALPSTMHNGITPGGQLIAGIAFETATRVRGYVIQRGLISLFDFPGATFTQAWDVSPTGTVVGYYNPEMSHGFLLDANGFTTIDIPGSRWTRIFGISPQGDLVGSYADSTNQVHGFLLRGGSSGH